MPSLQTSPTVRLSRSEPVVLIVSNDQEGWRLSHGGTDLGCFDTEWAALREADRLALQAYRSGLDARVCREGGDGKLHLEFSYGRHPDLD